MMSFNLLYLNISSKLLINLLMQRFRNFQVFQRLYFNYESYFYFSRIFSPKPINELQIFQGRIKNEIKSQNFNDQLGKAQVQEKLTQMLDYIYQLPQDNIQAFHKIFDECEDLLKDSRALIGSKTDANNLIDFLAKMKIQDSTYQLKRQVDDDFEITHVIPANYDRFCKKCENLLVKSNLSLKDPELLFDTIYQIPHIIQGNMALYVFLQEYLRNHGQQLNISVNLFFLTRLILHNKRESISTVLVQGALQRYQEWKDDLFDIGMMIFIYYESLSKYYMALNNLEKRQSAQYISLNLENKFRTRKNIKLTQMCQNSEDNDRLFYELALRDTLKLIDKFEEDKLQIRPEYFLQGIIFVFKSLGRFKITDSDFFRRFERIVEKYHTLLSLNDKIQLLQAFAKNLSLMPSFFEELQFEVYKGMKHLVWSLKYKPKVSLLKSSLDSAYISKPFYEHIKQKMMVFMKQLSYPEFCQINEEYFVTIDSILEYYWCIAKLQSPVSSDMVKLSNSLVNLHIDLYQKHQLVDMLQATCALSIKCYDQIDWKTDITKKISMISSKIRGWDPSNSGNPLIMNISNLYKSLAFVELKFGIQLVPNYFDENQMQYFRNEWFKSIQRFRTSKFETQVADFIREYCLEHQIDKKIKQNHIADIYNVDILIEPNIVIEINGRFHFLQDSKLKLIRDSYFGNFMMKIEHLEMKKYKIIMLQCYEYEEITDDIEKLRLYVINKVKPYLQQFCNNIFLKDLIILYLIAYTTHNRIQNNFQNFIIFLLFLTPPLFLFLVGLKGTKFPSVSIWFFFSLFLIFLLLEAIPILENSIISSSSSSIGQFEERSSILVSSV